MKAFLYAIVEMIAEIHSYLLKMNDAYEYNFSDKELHFLIIGALGMAMIFVVHPLFKWLVKNNHIMVISWIYVFTLIIVITFAIEIGQRVTHTGEMEFADIMFGVLGFISMFLVFSVFRGIYHLILRFIKGGDEDDQEDEDEDEDDEEEKEVGKTHRIRRQDEEPRVKDGYARDRRDGRVQRGSGYGGEPYQESRQGRRTPGGRGGYGEEPTAYREGGQGRRTRERSGSYGEEPTAYGEGRQDRRGRGGTGYEEEPSAYGEGRKDRRGRGGTGYEEEPSAYGEGRQGRPGRGGTGYEEEPSAYGEGRQGRPGRNGYGEESAVYGETRQSRRVQGGSGHDEEPYNESRQGHAQAGSGYDEETYQEGLRSMLVKSVSGYGEDV